MAEISGPENSFVRDLIAFILLILLLVLAAFGVLGEVMFAATLFPWLLVTVLLIGFGAAELGRRWLHSQGLQAAGLIFALTFVVLRFVELNPVKPFRAFYRDLAPGMTEAEVLDLLDHRFPAGGRFVHPQVDPMRDQWLWMTLDPHHSDYNSELITLRFEDGRLERGQYLPD